MNKRFSLISITFLFLVPLIQNPPTVNAGLNTPSIRLSDDTNFNLNSTLIGVSTGDSFTYVIGKYDVPIEGYSIYRNSTSGVEFNVKENQE